MTEAEALDISEEQWQELRKWNHTDQPHYSLETRRALCRYQIALQKYLSTGKFDRAESMMRGDHTQTLFYALLRARKKETGVCYYLNADEYEQVVHGNTGGPSDRGPGHAEQIDSAVEP